MLSEEKKLRCLFERKARFARYHSKTCIKKKKDGLEVVDSEIYLQSENTMSNNDTEPCAGDNCISIFVHNKKHRVSKKNKKYKIFKYSKNEIIMLVSSINTKAYLRKNHSNSLPGLTDSRFKYNIKRVRSSELIGNKKHQPYNKNFIVGNCCRSCDKPQCSNPFLNPLVAAKVYRCQLNAKEETCCCSCNSDAMFEVMKSLYDCYKRKNCDGCKCILCGYGVPLKTIGVGEEEIEKEKITVDKSTTAKREERMAKAKEAGLLTPLTGKTAEQKEKILKGLVQHGIPLPAGKTTSEKLLNDKIRKEMGLPPEPKTAAERAKMEKAYAEGIITPLEGKTLAQKEQALKRMAQAGISLPEGRTPSEKVIIDKVKAEVGAKPSAAVIPSEKLRKAKAAGFMTPLKGKTPQQKEKVLRGLAQHGIPFPEGETPSEKKLIDKVRKDMGLPPQPKTPSEKMRIAKSYGQGIITPLEGKTPEQKEKALRKMADAGVPLPEGQTPSEKALIAKVAAESRRKPSAAVSVPSAKMRKAKDEGLITPLQGKPPAQKEKILKGLAKHGIPFPEDKTPSEAKLIDKVRKEMGLPLEPKTPSGKIRMAKAYKAGIVTPLEGKTPEQKEKALRKMAEAGIPLPEGRTASEKALISKVAAEKSRKPSAVTVPSVKMRKAKAEGLLTPLEGKTPEQKEKILRGLATHGIPLPEGDTPSDVKLIGKVKKDMGLPPAPKTLSEKIKMAKSYAAGIITPLEGKTPAQKEKVLRKLVDAGIPLPEGRTASEKALISKILAEKAPKPLAVSVPSEKMRKAKAEGLITPLEGKPPAQKEKILKGLAKHGIPLPEGKTPSEAKLIDKVRKEMGLPLEPKTTSGKIRMAKAYKAGIVTPLEGKTPEQKEKALRKMAEAGIPLPEGRTASEKALISKVAAEKPPKPSAVSVPSEKMRKAKAEGLLTPLEGKTPEQKEKILRGLATHGIPLPEGDTPSDVKLIGKVKKDMGLPPAPKTLSEKIKMAKSYAAGIITPLEGKTPAQKEKVLRKLVDAGIPLPEGRTASEKALISKILAEKAAKPSAVSVPSEKMRKAKAEGLITPLQGKPPAQKEKILRGLAKQGIPFPEGKTPSETKLIDKVRKEMGLPLEPKTPSGKIRMAKAYKAGIVTPLEGKTPEQKEKALRKMAEAGIPLPEGRTASEKALISKVAAEKSRKPSAVSVPSEKMRKAKAEGLLTPLEGKTPEQKEKILRGLATHGIPLPEGDTPSDVKLIGKVKKDMGLPPAPKTLSEKIKMAKSYAAGIITPLEGKTPAQKEKVLRKLVDAGIPLPEGRTASEKALISKILAEKALKPSAVSVPSEKMRKAKAEGLITPLEGKTPEQKEKILRGLVKHGIPLPEGKTSSEKKLIDTIRKEMGLPPEPKTPSEKMKMAKSYAQGIITPLEGKTSEQKEKALRKMAEAGVLLPEGRTPSEKALIDKVKATAGLVKSHRPVLGGRPVLPVEQRQKLDLETGKNVQEGKHADECICDLLTPEPERKITITKLPSVKEPVKIPSEKLKAAKAAGLLTPLAGKSPEQQEKILQGLKREGLPFPEPKTDSERKLIDRIKGEKAAPSAAAVPSEKMRKAKAEGLLTPLEGKTPEQKEKILRGLAKHGVPLPEGKTSSEKKLIDKMRKEMGLPPQPKTPSEKMKMAKSYAQGIITPLEGKTPEQKEKALRKMAEAGVALPEGRTPSEKSLIAKVKAEGKPEVVAAIPSDKMRKAKAEGFITPLKGKTPEQKEKILRGLATHGIPLPEGDTPSDVKLIVKVRKDMGLPPTPKTLSEKIKMAKSYAAGIITPLEGKTPAQKEKVLRKLVDAGIPLPEGRTASEKALISKILAEKALKPSAVSVPSEKMRKAKAEGLITPLEGKTPEQKEKILRGLVKHGIPLPEGKTSSEKKLIDTIRKEMGLPPEPKTPSEKMKMAKSYAQGIITPLEGKTSEQKEKALRKMAEAGVLLPEGRTPSEKALIDKVKATAGLVKSHRPVLGGRPVLPVEQRQKLDLETGKNVQEGKHADECICDLLTPEPERKITIMKLPSVKEPVKIPSEKLKAAKAAGLLTPLAGKSPEQQEKILQGLKREGLPFPEPKTDSERKLIDRIKGEKAAPSAAAVPSEKMRKAKAAGLITPLKGKTPEQKEKILRGLATHGIPLPEGKTPSENQLIDKVRKEMGLPPEPKTHSQKMKMAKSYAKGIITPLEGKTPEQKEKALRRMAEAGIVLPEGRTPSEKVLIDKVKAEVKRPSKISVPSSKFRKAKAAGIITPLKGKTPEQKEKILRGLATHGIPLPEGKTPSENQLIDKVRKEMGLPPEPKTHSQKMKMAKSYAKGIITPLEGKTPEQKEKALRRMAEAGIALPEGRTSSEKVLIDKVKAEVKRASKLKAEVGVRPSAAAIPSEKLRKAKEAGIITPLKGKTPEQKEKILRGLAQHGIPFPEGETSSEKILIDKVRKDMGLPPEPKTTSQKLKMAKSYAKGIITPLEGKTHEQKEKALRRMAEAGIVLPEGRSPSEKSLISKLKKGEEKKYRPVHGKRPALEPEKRKKLGEETEKDIQEGKHSEECICDLLTPETERKMTITKLPSAKIPSEKLKAAKAAGLLTPLAGKSPEQKEKILRGLIREELPLPEPKTDSEKKMIDRIKAEKRLPTVQKIPSEKLRKAKAEGLLTPLEGKTPEQKEKILRGLAKHGIPLPEGKSPSETKLIDKVRKEMGLPPEPKTPSEKIKMTKSYAAGIITPLEGKTPEQKEKALRKMAEAGVALPEGRTPSEKSLIAKVKAEGKPEAVAAIPSDKMRKAKAEGFITPLKGKTPEQKEKILRGLATHGIPLPEGDTPSDVKLIVKVRKDMGLPPTPKTLSEKIKMAKSYAAGIITPLEGKTPEQKEKALRKLVEAGVALPEGRTPSEKSLIAKVKAEGKLEAVAAIPSDKMRKAKAEGFITPLKGKTPEQKEKILRGLATHGIPLPEGDTPSDVKLIVKVRKDMGLPPTPKTLSEKIKMAKSYAAGIITPLEGKTPEQKEKALRKLVEAGVALPEGRTPSEKSLIAKVKAEGKLEAVAAIPSDKMRKAKAEGFITPLKGKTPEQKEKILRGLATHGIPLPEGDTPSDVKLIVKVRKDMGLPPTPKTLSEKIKMAKSYAAGIITPLEGKTPAQKEKVLRKLVEAGIPLPEGRTPSEKSLIAKVKAETPRKPSVMPIPSEKLRKAKAEGLLTPLEGKTPEKKEKILRGLAKHGIPLPEGKSPSEKKLIDKVRKEIGLPPEPRTPSEKIKMAKSYAAGIITPLEGKTLEQKDKALRKMAKAGISLPEGRTPSEKALISKIQGEAKPEAVAATPSEKMRTAKAEGFITPLTGKTPEQKEKILRGLGKHGISLPEGDTPSEKKLIDKVRNDMGLPVPKTSADRLAMDEAYAAGLITPLEGKSTEQKEKALRRMYEAGVPLPEGRSASEKALINKIKSLPAPTKSEIKKKLKEKGITTMKGGISQEMEEIKKTTKCDRACGCDKKKIRFKHSYVKIRVTSPDISSLCDCPNECLPGVKSGVFVDNEGIKVTIGRATGVPSYVPSTNSAWSQLSTDSFHSTANFHPGQKYNSFGSAGLDSDGWNDVMELIFRKYYSKTIIQSEMPIDDVYTNASVKKIQSQETDYDTQLFNNFGFSKDILRIEDDAQETDYDTQVFNNFGFSKDILRIEDDDINDDSEVYMIASNSINSVTSSHNTFSGSNNSYDSIVLLQTESSLSISAVSYVSKLATISVISFVGSSTSTSYSSVGDKSMLDYTETVKALDFFGSKSDYYYQDDSRCSIILNIEDNNTSETSHYLKNTREDRSIVILRLLGYGRKQTKKGKKGGKKVSINDDNSDPKNIMEIVAEEILHKPTSDESSVFVVLPSSDYDSSTTGLSTPESTVKQNLLEIFGNYPIVTSEHQMMLASRGMKLALLPKETNGNIKDKDSVKKIKHKRMKNAEYSSMGRSLSKVNDINDKEKQTKEKMYDISGDICKYHINKITEHSMKEEQVAKKEPPTTLTIRNSSYIGFEIASSTATGDKAMKINRSKNNNEYHQSDNETKHEKNRETRKKKDPPIVGTKSRRFIGFDISPFAAAGDKTRVINVVKKTPSSSSNKNIDESVKPMVKYVSKSSTQTDLQQISEKTSRYRTGSVVQMVGTATSLEIQSCTKSHQRVVHEDGTSTSLEIRSCLKSHTKYIDTSCDRPCCCQKAGPKVNAPIKANACPASVKKREAHDTKADKRLTPEMYVRNVMDSYQSKYISLYSSPSDTLPCKCPPKSKSPSGLDHACHLHSANVAETKVSKTFRSCHCNKNHRAKTRNDKIKAAETQYSDHNLAQQREQKHYSYQYGGSKQPEQVCSRDNKPVIYGGTTSVHLSQTFLTESQTNQRVNPKSLLSTEQTQYSYRDLDQQKEQKQYRETKRPGESNINDIEYDRFGGLTTIQLSQALLAQTDMITKENKTKVIKEVPKAPPPSRRTTIFQRKGKNLMKEASSSTVLPPKRMGRRITVFHPNKTLGRKAETSSPSGVPPQPVASAMNILKKPQLNLVPYKCQPEHKCKSNLCNVCCRRGKIIEGNTPGRKCDPCARYGQPLPTGVQLSNTKHSKRHYIDLVCEGSTHSCCCPKQREVTPAPEQTEQCCKGETKEDITRAVRKFMDTYAKDEAKTENENICRRTLELLKGIEKACEEMKNKSQKGNAYGEQSQSQQNVEQFQCQKTTNQDSQPEQNSKFCETAQKICGGLSPPEPCPEGCRGQAVHKPKSDFCGGAAQGKLCGGHGIRPFINVCHPGLRALAGRPPVQKDVCCQCRTGKDGEPLYDECVCPVEENCKCPSLDEEVWFDYIYGDSKFAQRVVMQIKSDMTQTTSGFKFMKKRKELNENLTFEEALEFFSKAGVIDGTNEEVEKTEDENTCPGCGDYNCPGTWKFPSVGGPHTLTNIGPATLVPGANKFATEEMALEKNCPGCGDNTCPGLGPSRLLPPIPGDKGVVEVTGPAERGPHKACACEPREDYERDRCCPPIGPITCECDKGSGVGCECPPSPEPEPGAEESQKKEDEIKEEKKEEEARGTRVAFKGAEIFTLPNAQMNRELIEGGALGGFSLKIGGKGSASPGLQGICCFNAYEDAGKSDSSEGSTYLIYTV